MIPFDPEIIGWRLELKRGGGSSSARLHSLCRPWRRRTCAKMTASRGNVDQNEDHPNPVPCGDTLYPARLETAPVCWGIQMSDEQVYIRCKRHAPVLGPEPDHLLPVSPRVDSQHQSTLILLHFHTQNDFACWNSVERGYPTNPKKSAERATKVEK